VLNDAFPVLVLMLECSQESDTKVRFISGKETKIADGTGNDYTSMRAGFINLRTPIEEI
jgi:hypothetical protein